MSHSTVYAHGHKQINGITEFHDLKMYMGVKFMQNSTKTSHSVMMNSCVCVWFGFKIRECENIIRLIRHTNTYNIEQ